MPASQLFSLTLALLFAIINRHRVQRRFLCSGIEAVITGLTRNQFVGNHTRVRIPPAAPENGAMSMFIGMAPLFIVLTPTAFFLALPPAFGQLLGQCKGLFHHGGAQLFRLGIQMGVDVGRGGDIAVSQPFLYLLHGHTLLQQQAGAGVP